MKHNGLRRGVIIHNKYTTITIIIVFVLTVMLSLFNKSKTFKQYTANEVGTQAARYLKTYKEIVRRQDLKKVNLFIIRYFVISSVVKIFHKTINYKPLITK